MKREVLVTGGCGYIGSHVTRQLSEAGYRVVVVDDLRTGFRDALVHGEELIVHDVGDESFLNDLMGSRRIEAVLHFAASIVVPESVARPLQYYENNTVNTVKLLKACVAHRVRHFVFSSTGSVYGDTLADTLSETTPAVPTNPYSRSKLMMEWILGDVSRATSLRHVILRYFNVAGADPQKRMGQKTAGATHLIKVACEALTGKRESVTIFGEDYGTPDGTGIRDYIHVEDLASAHLAALKYLDGGGESILLNCGYGRGFSVKEVLAEAQRVGGSLQVLKGARRPGDVPRLVADTTRIRQVLDWKPRYDDLGEIVRSALEWERTI